MIKNAFDRPYNKGDIQPRKYYGAGVGCLKTGAETNKHSFLKVCLMRYLSESYNQKCNAVFTRNQCNGIFT